MRHRGLLAEIGRLTEANRARRDRETERRLLRLRHLAGVRLLDEPTRPPSTRRPTSAGLPAADGLPEIAPARPDAGAAARRHPARRLPARARPRRPRGGARARRGRSTARSRSARRSTPARAPAAGYYEEFEPEARVRGRLGAAVDPGGRRRARGRLADARLRDARAVRGRGPARPGRRLPRRAAAAVGAQDDAAQGRAVRRRRLAPGRRLHGRRARAQPLALAVALRRRGARPRHRPAPRSTRSSIDARRRCSTSSSRAAKAAEAAGDVADPAPDLRARRRAVLRRAVPAPDRRPIPSMPNPRFAIESWFFGGSAFPADYAPLAV